MILEKNYAKRRWVNNCFSDFSSLLDIPCWFNSDLLPFVVGMEKLFSVRESKYTNSTVVITVSVLVIDDFSIFTVGSVNVIHDRK